MLLVADIGNTSTTIGVYEGDKLINSWKLSSDKKRSEDEYGIMISSIAAIIHAIVVNFRFFFDFFTSIYFTPCSSVFFQLK